MRWCGYNSPLGPVASAVLMVLSLVMAMLMLAPPVLWLLKWPLAVIIWIIAGWWGLWL
jgi:hypothetical protein